MPFFCGFLLSKLGIFNRIIVLSFFFYFVFCGEVALLFFFTPCYVDWDNCELKLVGKHPWNVWILVFRSLAVPLVGMTSSFVADTHFLSIGGWDWVARLSRGSHVYPWRSLVLQQWLTCSSYAILTNFHLAVHHCVQEKKLVNITPKISVVSKRF